MTGRSLYSLSVAGSTESVMRVGAVHVTLAIPFADSTTGVKGALAFSTTRTPNPVAVSTYWAPPDFSETALTLALSNEPPDQAPTA